MDKDELQCNGKMIETIPIGLTYNTTIASTPTFEELIKLISNAEKSIDIASYYWSLLGTDVMPKPDNSSIKGKLLLDSLIKRGKSGKVEIRIAVNGDNSVSNDTDLKLLNEVADIREVNFTHLMGAGILHTKFIIIDSKHFYIGSANMDWRSLTHVKELGISIYNCSTLAMDLKKIFEVYWYLGKKNASIPSQWPHDYETEYNIKDPLLLSVNDLEYSAFISSSPKPFCPKGRTDDIEAILYIINNAKKFISIAVMDYFPTFLYTKDHEFWPIIDDALKRAVIERKVHVKLLASHWNHTRRTLPYYLKSLTAFNDTKIFGGNIEAKLFIVPSTPDQTLIPFARVNHNKYMVTESVAYIGTSNWSADYFVSTGGVGFVLIAKNNTNGKSLRDDLENVFHRDWNSIYSHTL